MSGNLVHIGRSICHDLTDGVFVGRAADDQLAGANAHVLECRCTYNLRLDIVRFQVAAVNGHLKGVIQLILNAKEVITGEFIACSIGEQQTDGSLGQLVRENPVDVPAVAEAAVAVGIIGCNPPESFNTCTVVVSERQIIGQIYNPFVVSHSTCVLQVFVDLPGKSNVVTGLRKSGGLHVTAFSGSVQDRVVAIAALIDGDISGDNQHLLGVRRAVAIGVRSPNGVDGSCIRDRYLGNDRRQLLSSLVDFATRGVVRRPAQEDITAIGGLGGAIQRVGTGGQVGVRSGSSGAAVGVIGQVVLNRIPLCSQGSVRSNPDGIARLIGVCSIGPSHECMTRPHWRSRYSYIFVVLVGNTRWRRPRGPTPVIGQGVSFQSIVDSIVVVFNTNISVGSQLKIDGVGVLPCFSLIPFQRFLDDIVPRRQRSASGPTTHRKTDFGGLFCICDSGSQLNILKGIGRLAVFSGQHIQDKGKCLLGLECSIIVIRQSIRVDGLLEVFIGQHFADSLFSIQHTVYMVAHAVIEIRVVRISGCRMADLGPADSIVRAGIFLCVTVLVGNCNRKFAYIPLCINRPLAAVSDRGAGNSKLNITCISK